MSDSESTTPQNSQMCPRCGRNLIANVQACSCGWIDPGENRRVDKQMSKKLVNTMFKIIILLVPFIIYFSQWRGFGMEVTYLRLGSVLRLDSVQSELRLADIYVQTENTKLALNKYKEIIKRFPKEYQAYLILAKMQLKQKDYADAAQTFQGYLQNGGEDSNSLIKLKLAEALASSGHVDDAIQMYQKILNAEPDILQVTVAQAYVKLLIDNNRWDDAKKVVHDFRARGSNGKDYLSDEWAKIKDHFNNSTKKTNDQ